MKHCKYWCVTAGVAMFIIIVSMILILITLVDKIETISQDTAQINATLNSWEVVE